MEEKLRNHMENQALGTLIVPDRTVKSVVDAITACQGAFIVRPVGATFAAAAASIDGCICHTISSWHTRSSDIAGYHGQPDTGSSNQYFEE